METHLEKGEESVVERSPLSVVEVKEGDPRYENALSISVYPDETEEVIEVRVQETVQSKHWFMQDRWVNKEVRERISFSVGEKTIDLFNFEKELSNEQVAEIRRAIEDYAALDVPQVFERVCSVLIDNRQLLNPHTGTELNGYGELGGAITLYPHALLPIPHRVLGVSNLEGTVIHELSHSLGVEFQNAWARKFEWEQLDTPVPLPGGEYKYFQVSKPERCVTEYAQINPAEDICESVVAALRNPDVLDVERYEWIKKALVLENTQRTVVAVERKTGKDAHVPRITEPVAYKTIQTKRSSFRITSLKNKEDSE